MEKLLGLIKDSITGIPAWVYMERHIIHTIFQIALSILAMVPGFLCLLWFRWKRRGKRSPISKDTLRGPGESLRKKLSEIDEKINGSILAIVGIPVMTVTLVLITAFSRGREVSFTDLIAIFFLLSILLPTPLVLFYRRIREWANYALGLDAELAVGRELNQIMRDGFYVFHDFPEEHNNIDHVVVGPYGVFAVETKGRAKPDKGRGAVDAKVIFTGDALYFPDNAKETKAIAQAKKQAATLSKWLSSAVGEQVKVRPALALPGWFIERKKPDDLILLYGKASTTLAPSKAMDRKFSLNR